MSISSVEDIPNEFMLELGKAAEIIVQNYGLADFLAGDFMLCIEMEPRYVVDADDPTLTPKEEGVRAEVSILA
jgi:hypothetical protein